MVIAGLAALEGPRHGGAGARVESMLESMRDARRCRRALGARLRRGERSTASAIRSIATAIRARDVLLDLLGERYAKSAEHRFVAGVRRGGGRRVTGEHPNIDFALAAVARVLELPRARR